METCSKKKRPNNLIWPSFLALFDLHYNTFWSSFSCTSTLSTARSNFKADEGYRKSWSNLHWLYCEPIELRCGGHRLQSKVHHLVRILIFNFWKMFEKDKVRNLVRDGFVVLVLILVFSNRKRTSESIRPKKRKIGNRNNKSCKKCERKESSMELNLELNQI